MKINSKLFNFDFFLSNKVKVADLNEAAKQNGGATLNMETGELYSNVEGNEFIQLKKDRELNTLSLFIPDTYNINNPAGEGQKSRFDGNPKGIQKIRFSSNN